MRAALAERARGERRGVLRDGTPVLIRPIGPQDAGALQAGFEGLSETSRVFRFLRPVPELSEADLFTLSHPDHRGHEAIGALGLGRDPPEPAGIARYFCLGAGSARAEFAVTVVDAYQARGLGTLLLGILARIASERGIAEFVALVHRENHAMIRLLRDLGAVPGSTQRGDREFILPLHRDPALYPGSPAGAALRAAHALWEGA